MAGNTCDVCCREDQEVIGVASSSLGAISFAFCYECLRRGAEPYFMFAFLKNDIAGGVKGNLCSECFNMETFHEGEYKTLEQVWNTLPPPESP